ncbi:TorD/DmsD family molecular chaperone [Neobacillus muris]|uniref:TorD/DmsD family molecular chaperone n=1 Tax=Neobacillus muris TaxID=2941334 RepID=UPI00204205FB|nr:molecular chaperone TorD family protein [Neobacillus muris]
MTTTGEVFDFDLMPFLQSRRNVYQLIYLLFMEPKADQFLYDLGKGINFKELEEFQKEIGKTLEQFFNQISDEQILKQKEEFHRLFIGPGQLAAPPWESYYRSKDHLLFEECMFQIRDLYYQFGLQNIKENKEPDDHLLLELEFMIFLSEQSLQQIDLEELKRFISTQIEFLQNHLLTWIPPFCERIFENTTSSLYLGAAMLLEDFCWCDLEALIDAREAL